MSAIVAVLNRHGVSIAADSAVTLGNTHKVVNSGNKIFTLSKYYPVAIMTYSNASFMNVPWDIIIKEYRKSLQQRSFPKLSDYQDDFIKYVVKNNFFCDDETQHIFLQSQIRNFYEINLKIASSKSKIQDFSDPNLYSFLITEFNECSLANSTSAKCPMFEDYTKEDFLKYSKEDFDAFYNGKYPQIIKDQDKTIFEESYFQYLRVQIETTNYTGLVFVGYGEEEIYPSLIPVNASIAFDGRWKYFVDESRIGIIGDKYSNAIVSPFAQIDVVQTIIRGINPGLKDIVTSIVRNSTASLVKHIKQKVNLIPGDNKNKADILAFDENPIIDDIVNSINQNMFNYYTQPLLETIVNLDKDDMANMAESFIALTSLIRRMSPGEETVGGPVDVAFISKGDGFVWIKRKHYFKPDLNHCFFENYYKL